MAQEEVVWTGSPSQWINVPVYLLCALFFWLVIPVFVAIWKWLVLRSIQYELTTERLRIRQGVLNKELDELELYRVRDYRLERPLFLRMFSLGNITLRSSDTSHPAAMLRAIRDGEAVREQIRNYVEECRVRKRVLPLDMEQP
jgi:uncharacterized membrane protein YdbT with pleckstrin-like domain